MLQQSGWMPLKRWNSFAQLNFFGKSISKLFFWDRLLFLSTVIVIIGRSIDKLFFMLSLIFILQWWPKIICLKWRLLNSQVVPVFYDRWGCLSKVLQFITTVALFVTSLLLLSGPFASAFWTGPEPLLKLRLVGRMSIKSEWSSTAIIFKGLCRLKFVMR